LEELLQINVAVTHALKVSSISPSVKHSQALTLLLKHNWITTKKMPYKNKDHKSTEIM